MVLKNKLPVILGLLVLVAVVHCEETEAITVGREMLEQGRTFVHHAIKRMAFIMPAIFFKMGIAFSLLLLVTIVSINNGFIGFMLLVVGLSSVLAKLQEARTAGQLQHVPYVIPQPHYGPHFLDRSDTSVETPTKSQINYGHTTYPYTDVVYNKYVPTYATTK